MMMMMLMPVMMTVLVVMMTVMMTVSGGCMLVDHRARSQASNKRAAAIKSHLIQVGIFHHRSDQRPCLATKTPKVGLLSKRFKSLLIRVVIFPTMSVVKSKGTTRMTYVVPSQMKLSIPKEKLESLITCIT